ncbi:regulatory protein RecX [Sphingomonas profundi]|uniref:regulatory protein RecX n=1 Tax=Alterirhizorhabdus profundi TaxID=2681549 RepID=UPI0012E8AB6F|nr:RecX family transcriptional regulator [Sphingomonas profundi]
MARATTDRAAPAAAPPLDGAALERLALAYVGRYATTRARLRAYLARKLRARGWGGEGPAPVEALIETCVRLGYVDDRQFAAARAGALGRRGYGARRVGDALRAAGIDEADGADAREQAGDAAWETAIAFARRRRIGPFAAVAADQDGRRRALAAMLRAGHPLDIARKLVGAAPGEVPNHEHAAS